MVFSSIPFLYYFLPVVLILSFLVPKGWKNAVLLLASLVFYGWGEPKLLALMVVTIAVFYICGLAIGSAQNPGRKKFWLMVSVVTGVLLLGIFKYADFFIGSFNTLTGLGIPLLRLALPVGISFYTFQCLSYTIDVYRGSVPAQKNIVSFGAYVALFPQLIAGPIVRYVDIARQLEDRTQSWEDAALGMRRFLIGLGKKVILADNFALLVQIFRDASEPSVLFYWMYAIAFALNIYFDFSGYSDMAIGLGRILGFRFLENFNYPYMSRSITEFWRRWHMSLGFGIALLAEKMIPGLKRLPAVLAHGYVLLVVVLSFVLFNATSLYRAVGDFAGLFGLAGLPFSSVETRYYLKSYALLFLVGIVGSTPLIRMAAEKVSRMKAGFVLEIVAMAGLLLVCTAYLVDGSFSPFLYFRF